MTANNLKDTKIKAIIFDFDGTISMPCKYSNGWSKIFEKIHMESEDERLYKLHKEGKLNYDEWENEILKIYRDCGVNSKFFKDIAKDTILLKNTTKVFKALYKKGIKIIILSGGIKNIIILALGKACKYVYRIEAQEFLFDKDMVVNDIKKLDHYVEDKSQFTSYVLDMLELHPDQVVFFGNDENDEDVYKTEVKTICINPITKNYNDRRIWSEVILKTDDLSSILAYL